MGSRLRLRSRTANAELEPAATSGGAATAV